jgi:hypothetical protein
MTSPWTGRETSASGQTFEFRVWAALMEQSRGRLHVFLPTADRGVDGLVHRLTDGVYIPIQAKDRTRLVDGEVKIVARAKSLAHDDVVIVGGQLAEGGIGPTMLVVPVPDFKRLANLSSDKGEAVYTMRFGMRPRSDSRWLPWLVPTERMAERLGVSVEGVLEEVAVEPRPEWRSDVGYLGESEVVRRLAEDGNLNLFRPFPDSETVELAVLHLTSRRVVGLQIKTVGVTQARLSSTVDVYASSFRPLPSTYFIVLAWWRPRSHPVPISRRRNRQRPTGQIPLRVGGAESQSHRSRSAGSSSSVLTGIPSSLIASIRSGNAFSTNSRSRSGSSLE